MQRVVGLYSLVLYNRGLTLERQLLRRGLKYDLDPAVGQERTGAEPRAGGGRGQPPRQQGGGARGAAPVHCRAREDGGEGQSDHRLGGGGADSPQPIYILLLNLYF